MTENIHLETEKAEYSTIKQGQQFKELQCVTQAQPWCVAHSDHKIKTMCTCPPMEAEKALESIRKQAQTSQESKVTMQSQSWDTKHSEYKYQGYRHLE